MSPTSNTFNAISICCRSNNSTTCVPSSSFLAKWLAILDSVLLLPKGVHQIYQIVYLLQTTTLLISNINYPHYVRSALNLFVVCPLYTVPIDRV